MACVSSAHLNILTPPSNNMMLLAPPRASMESPRKNPYTVLRELGAGLQGRVVLARDERTDAHVAIKLPSAFDDDEAFDAGLLDYQVQSILREREAHRIVQHDNIIQCHRLVPGKKHGRAYVAMVTEYASNGDLFDTIAEHGALPPSIAKFYFHQLVRGVEACHERGVVHRDIKPENILFDDDFTLKLCDFGLAMTTNNGAHADAMVLREVSGTALYMAPEVRAMKSYRAAPVDVWACGVVLFIILTSYPPFQDACPGDFWYDCVVSGRMRKFWASQPKSMAKPPAHAIDLLNRMLCADPEKRITIPEIVAHPWLRDVGTINPAHVFNAMTQRRRKATESPLA